MDKRRLKFWETVKFDYYLVSEDGSLKVQCFKRNLSASCFEYEVSDEHADRVWKIMNPEASKALNQAIKNLKGMIPC